MGKYYRNQYIGFTNLDVLLLPGGTWQARKIKGHEIHSYLPSHAVDHLGIELMTGLD
jgi:hypothetical protein